MSQTAVETIAGCIERAFARADAIDAEAARLFPLGQTVNSNYPRSLQALASQIRSDIASVAIALIECGYRPASKIEIDWSHCDGE